MKTDLSKYNNAWYKPGNPVKRILWYFFNVFFLMNPWNPFSGLKKAVLKMFGAKIGKGVVIKPGINVKYPWKLEIGNYVWIGENVWIDNLAKVTIGSNSCISQGALLLCGNHNYKKETFDLIVGDIRLEEGVWIGAKAIVTARVTCYSHSILTAGSVATFNLEAYGIYQGNPAALIRKREVTKV
ncbi:MAG: colanic acid biosynthesis acetyltransferase WcaF [Crocinitomicaceae bacterium]|nr:colanic acid biosynthesis acetyltransferase WcaF [Crocinitomicaceae bacterium]